MDPGNRGSRPNRVVQRNGEFLPSAAEARKHLECIFASPAFRGSKRCQEFLQFIVEHALAGQPEMLKERTIGVELFGREASYETAGDPIVRVKANEVRKRLAQFYQEAGAAEEFQILLPAGAYVPEFQRAGAQMPTRTGARRLRWTVLIALALAVTLAAALWIPRWKLFPSERDRFWAPLLDSPRPAIVCMGTSQAVRVAGPLRQALERIAAGERGLLESLKVTRDDLVPMEGDWVARGNFFALLDLALLLQKYGKAAEFRPGTEIAFDELRDRPIVLIGAFNNQWTMALSKDFRFCFDQSVSAGGEVTWMVRDQMDPRRRWTVNAAHPRNSAVDYAIVTRLVEPRKRGIVYSAAGISWFGTQVAGSFITDAERWRELAHGAPGGWHRKNIQIVLETKVVRKTPNPPKVVATHFW